LRIVPTCTLHLAPCTPHITSHISHLTPHTSYLIPHSQQEPVLSCPGLPCQCPIAIATHPALPSRYLGLYSIVLQRTASHRIAPLRHCSPSSPRKCHTKAVHLRHGCSRSCNGCAHPFCGAQSSREGWQARRPNQSGRQTVRAHSPGPGRSGALDHIRVFETSHGPPATPLLSSPLFTPLFTPLSLLLPPPLSLQLPLLSLPLSLS
jgi:hypothetical protein